MANQGAKKRKEENRKHMSTLLRVILASNVRFSSLSLFFLFYYLLNSVDLVKI